MQALEALNFKEIEGRKIAVDWTSGEAHARDQTASNRGTVVDAAKAGDRSDTRDPVETSASDPTNGAEAGTDSSAKRNADRSVFVRNIPFGATETDIFTAFRKFGKIQFAKLVIDMQTKRSKGSAFVQFAKSRDAKAAIEECASSALILSGRVLRVDSVVTKDRARVLTQESRDSEKASDKRRLYLAKEAYIPPDSDIARQIPKSDMDKRRSVAQQKKLKLANPNFYISATRLSVRNLSTKPVIITPSAKALLLPDTKGGKKRRKRLREEHASSSSSSPSGDVPVPVDNRLLISLFKQAAITGVDLGLVSKEDVVADLLPESEEAWDNIFVSNAKIVTDTSPEALSRGGPQSRGYGFVEFSQHVHALAALRFLNNNPETFTFCSGPKGARTPVQKRHRLIVEFAVEDARKVAIIEKKRKARDASKNVVPPAESAEFSEPPLPKTKKMKKAATRSRQDAKFKSKLLRGQKKAKKKSAGSATFTDSASKVKEQLLKRAAGPGAAASSSWFDDLP
jgi:nucleolar protein 4